MTEARPIRFSVVMPAYQAFDTISRAVDSVRAQTYDDWELIVIDDGSDDGTASEARFAAEGDRRVRVFVEEHRGCAGARRRGAEVARGEFITNLDADDEFVRDTLAILARAIDESPGYDIYSANGVKRSSHGEEFRAIVSPRFDRSVSLSADDIIENPWIYSGGATIRKGVLDSLGGFRADFQREDHDLWLRALVAGARHLYIPADIYVQNIDVPGRLAADPISSNLSYIASLEDLEARGLLTSRQRAIAAKSKERFRRRSQQLEESGTTVAMYADDQARRFIAWANRRFGPRLGGVVIHVAFALRGLVRPARVVLARAERQREMHR